MADSSQILRGRIKELETELPSSSHTDQLAGLQQQLSQHKQEQACPVRLAACE